MAKTALTREIEKALYVWAPTKMGDISLNTMRPGFSATEVPVENGTVTSGLVDYVWIAESLENVKTEGRCRLYQAQRSPELLDMMRSAARKANCPEADTVDFSTEEKLCDNTDCRCHTQTRFATNGILIICVEIKITKADFKNKHGHNFCGNCNFYAMPKDLYPQVKDIIPHGVGVLLFYDGKESKQGKAKDGTICAPYYGLKTKIAPKYCSMTDETQKWLVLSTAKRMRKEMLAMQDKILAGSLDKPDDAFW